MRYPPNYLTCAAFAAALGVCVSAVSADLQVDISQTEQNNGLVYFALYDSPSAYDQQRMREGMTSKAGDTPPSAVFADLPAGEYVVAVFQDENGNQKLDTNLMGIPREPYGFSQDAIGAMGPPDFSSAAVTLSVDAFPQVITIKMRN